jgi:hypothetical protein
MIIAFSIIWVLVVAATVVALQYRSGLVVLLHEPTPSQRPQLRTLFHDRSARRRRIQQAIADIRSIPLGASVAVRVTEPRFVALGVIASHGGRTFQLKTSRVVPSGSLMEISTPGYRIAAWAVGSQYSTEGWVVEASLVLEDREVYLHKNERRVA